MHYSDCFCQCQSQLHSLSVASSTNHTHHPAAVVVRLAVTATMLASLLPVAGIAPGLRPRCLLLSVSPSPMSHSISRAATVLAGVLSSIRTVCALTLSSLCCVCCAVCVSFTRSSHHRSRHARLLLFDGVCNVCNVFVNVVLDYDVAGSFYFLPLQSSVGQQLLCKYNLPADLDSMVLIDHADDVVKHIQTAAGTQPAVAAASSSTFASHTSSSSSTASSSSTGPLPPFPAASPSIAYIRSTAIFVTLGCLSFPLSLACVLLLLPLSIRDGGYRAFAAVRYRVFGMSDECRLMTKEGRKRFLDGHGTASSTTKKAD